MVERRTTLKEPDYRGNITVSAKANGDFLSITVADNGMGVKAEDMKKAIELAPEKENLISGNFNNFEKSNLQTGIY